MTVLKEGAALAEMGWLLGVTTAVFMGMMLAWVAWLASPSRNALMEEASRMPLDDRER